MPESREAWKGQENLGVVQVVVLVLSGREEDWEVDCWSFWWSGLTSAEKHAVRICKNVSVKCWDVQASVARRYPWAPATSWRDYTEAAAKSA